MTASAKLMLNGFQPFYGLDRKYLTEFWHVYGVTAGDAGWTPANTQEKVISVVPRVIGYPHPDAELKSAICTGLRLVEGPWPQADGTLEAIVQVTFDSDRRWGAGFRFSGGMERDDRDMMIPGWTRTTLSATGATGAQVNWKPNSVHLRRPGFARLEPRNGTGMTETEKGAVFSYVGKPFSVFGIVYLMETPTITRLRTNQTIISYRFYTSCPVRRMAAGEIPGIDVVVPELHSLDDYTQVYDPVNPSIGVALASRYGSPLDPTTLPYWGQPLV